MVATLERQPLIRHIVGDRSRSRHLVSFGRDFPPEVGATLPGDPLALCSPIVAWRGILTGRAAVPRKEGAVTDMGAGPSGNPAFIVVGAVLLLVIAVGAISRANARQRPILWIALSVVLLMLLFPPWIGEKGVWVNALGTSEHREPKYVRSAVSMGYAPFWHTPERQHFNTWRPIRVNWRRLGIQVGTVVLVTVVITRLLRRKRRAIGPEPAIESECDPPHP